MVETLDKADVVVAGGAGLDDEEGFEILQELAEARLGDASAAPAEIRAYVNKLISAEIAIHQWARSLSILINERVATCAQLTEYTIAARVIFHAEMKLFSQMVAAGVQGIPPVYAFHPPTRPARLPVGLRLPEAVGTTRRRDLAVHDDPRAGRLQGRAIGAWVFLWRHDGWRHTGL